MSVFGAKPGILMTKSNELTNQGEEFLDNYKRIFATIDEMLTSDYTSEDARQIVQNIKDYEGDLHKMKMAIDSYGKFCRTAANDVTRNQDDIMSGLNNKFTNIDMEQ